MTRTWRGDVAVRGVAACCLALGLVSAQGAAGQAAGRSCTVTELQTVAGGDNLLLGTDRTGRYQIGVRVYWDAHDVHREHLIRWRDGVAQLGPELDTIGAEFTAIGPNGVATGFRDQAGHHQAALFAYGQVLGLTAPAAGVSTTAVAVNSAGTVTGGALPSDGQIEQVLVWSADGEVSRRAVPDGFRYAQPIAIDEDGAVLGLATNDLSMYEDSRVVVWLPDGTPRLMPGQPGMRSWPVAIHDGTVIASQDSATGWGNVAWRPAGSAAPHALDTGGLALQAVNAGGSILGTDQDGNLALLRDGELTALPPEIGSAARQPLSDRDVVYGTTRGGGPASFDCRT